MGRPIPFILASSVEFFSIIFFSYVKFGSQTSEIRRVISSRVPRYSSTKFSVYFLFQYLRQGVPNLGAKSRVRLVSGRARLLHDGRTVERTKEKI